MTDHPPSPAMAHALARIRARGVHLPDTRADIGTDVAVLTLVELEDIADHLERTSPADPTPTTDELIEATTTAVDDVIAELDSTRRELAHATDQLAQAGRLARRVADQLDAGDAAAAGRHLAELAAILPAPGAAW